MAVQQAPGTGMFALTPTTRPTLAPDATLALVNDEPVAAASEDLLGTGRAAGQLAGLLDDSRRSTPFTLAVDAGWGMGKSSLMHLVDARLRAREDVETVWYNAWTSTGADALEGLIKSVLLRFERRLLKRSLARITGRRSVVRGARAVVTALGGALGAAGLVDELWQSYSASPEARNNMRDEIGRMAREWGEAAPQRLLVVFIDDLDRCSEETVLAVCEAVKVYLDVPGLAFVVGCDRSALGPNGLLRDVSPATSAFMEKIFQTSYRIPPPDADGVRAYVAHCARTAGIADMLDEELMRLLIEHSGRNPRRIKRLINGFVLEATLNPVWKDLPPAAVIRTLLLQYFYPDFYRMLTNPSSAPDGGGVVEEFRTYRRVRRTLQLLAAGQEEVPDGWADGGEIDAFLREHEVFPPADPRQDAAQSLEQLERRLPLGFPDLAEDPGFVGLLEELLKLERAEELLLRLREGVPAVVPEERPSYGQPPSAYVPQPPYGQQAAASAAEQQEPYVYAPVQVGPVYGGPPYDVAPAAQPAPPPAGTEPWPGLSILWVDDHPENNESFVRDLRDLGATIRTARNREEAEQALAGGRFDVLISDIARGTDRSAGLETLRHWRESGTYTGPAVFFASRITPERLERAVALGAEVTNSGPQLQVAIRRAVSAERAARPAPEGTGSAGPPG